ncbi:MAG: hypothetical protein JST92_10650 [Deltaproteobacteria bacterium]|nr:hypothetical protein [Deltaproteobacteria bacterium]
MPLRSAQLLFRAPSLDAAGSALERALKRQKAPSSARALLVLQVDDWCALVEPGGKVDGGLARLVSDVLGGLVLAVELDESQFSLRLRRYEQGEPKDELKEPAEVARAAAESAREGAGGAQGTMPLVKDVSKLLWDALKADSVPASLRILAPDELTNQLEHPRDAGVQGLRVMVAEQTVVLFPQRVVPPDTKEGDEPPVEPDTVVVSAAGEQRALEVRRLPGLEPTLEAARAIVALEETVAKRLCRMLAGVNDEQRVPRPSFTYRMPRARIERELTMEDFAAGPSEGTEALLPLRERARAERPWLLRLNDPERETPLTHAGFCELCLKEVRAALPEAKVTRAHGLSLELLHPAGNGAVVRVNLSAAYERQLVAEPPVEDPAGPAIEAAKNLLALPCPPVSEWPRETVLAGLLPTVLHLSEASGRASEPLGGLICSALLCDDGDRVLPVFENDLEAQGIPFDEALARAIDNVDALTLHAPRGLLWFDTENGRVAVTDFDDPAGAGRLLSPLFRSLLDQIVGGTVWAAVPTRDSLIACDPELEEAARWLREEAALRHKEGAFPIDVGVWDISETDLIPVADDPLAAVKPLEDDAPTS